MPERTPEKLFSLRNSLNLIIVIMGNLSLFLPVHLSMIFGLLFIAFLPGFLILRYLLNLDLEPLENIAFSYFASMIALTICIMPLDFVFSFDVRIAALVFVDLLFVATMIVHAQTRNSSPSNTRKSLKHSKTIGVFAIFVFLLNLTCNVVNKIKSDGSLFIDWDHGIYLALINALSGGIPAMDPLRSNLRIQPEMGFFPQFYFYGTLLGFTKVSVFPLILFVNALTHCLFTVLVYYAVLRFFHKHDAAVFSSVFLSLGSELYWIVQSLGLVFPAGYFIPFSLYRGTGVPFARVDSSVNVPSVGIESIAKGFHHLPSLAFCILFISFLSIFLERKKIRYLLAALVCLLPMLPSQPLVFLFFVTSFIPLFPLVLLWQRSEAKRILPLFVFGALSVAGWFFAMNAIASEPFMIYLRYYPMWKSLTCLFLYLGAPFALGILGFRLVNTKNRVITLLLLSWILTCAFFIFFTDLFHLIEMGSWHGYYVYFSIQVPWLMFAGIGMSELRRKAFATNLTHRNPLRKKLTSVGLSFLIVVPIVMIGLVSQYQYINSWVTQNDPYYSYWGINISRLELDAYEWIRVNTPKNAVFLVNPDNWMLACFTERRVITTDRGIPQSDERILDVRTAFTSSSLRDTVSVLSKYNASYVFLSSVENKIYETQLCKFFAFTRNFELRFSNEEVNIVEVVSLELPSVVATSLTVSADNSSKSVNQSIRVSGTLLRNDTVGMPNMTVIIEQFPPYQLTKGLKLLLDEGSGTICYDTSGNGNKGLISGASWVEGKSGYALDFDGTTDYVEVGNSTTLSPVSEIRIDLWLKIGQNGDFKRVLTKSKYPASDYGLVTYGRSGRSLYFFVRINNTEYQSPLSKNLEMDRWYHILCTYRNGDKVRLYVDNEEQGNGTSASGLIDDHSGSLFIGGMDGDFFNGTIDELKISTEASTKMSTNTDAEGNYAFLVESQIPGSATFRVWFGGKTTMNEEILECSSPETTLTWTETGTTPMEEKKAFGKSNT